MDNSKETSNVLVSRQTNIVVNFQIEGFHNWPEAPLEVDFLRQRHRHMFHIKAVKQVQHDDRDIEIILFGREIKEYLAAKYARVNNVHEFGRRSCETLATELSQKFELVYCQVLEDNENGAEVYVKQI